MLHWCTHSVYMMEWEGGVLRHKSRRSARAGESSERSKGPIGMLCHVASQPDTD